MSDAESSKPGRKKEKDDNGESHHVGNNWTSQQNVRCCYSYVGTYAPFPFQTYNIGDYQTL